jgi:hypothetical protein
MPIPSKPRERIEYSTDHKDIFGKGKHLTAREKCLLQHVKLGISIDEGLDIDDPDERKTLLERFEKITNGFSKSTFDRLETELLETDGFYEGPESLRGPKPPHLEYDIPDLDNWLRSKVDEVKKKGFLTVPKIQELIQTEKNRTVTKYAVRGALERLGYKWCTRRKYWITRRTDPKVLRWLKRYVTWIHNNSTLHTLEIDGEELQQFRFNFVVCYQALAILR